MEIASQVNEKRDLRQAMIFYKEFGITMNLAVKIYNKYGQEVYGILKENPYRLADDIEGVGFRRWTILQQRQESGRILISVCGVGYCIHCFRRLVRGIPFATGGTDSKTSELLGIDKDIIEKIIWICQLTGKSL